jgi:hypothetical protein
MKVRDNVVYHVECFRCTECGVKLVPGDRFALGADGRGVVCQRDHLQRRQLQQQEQLVMAATFHGRNGGKIHSSLVSQA